jgi:hypothetical protein
MNDIAAMLVANGQGLIDVNIPNQNAITEPDVIKSIIFSSGIY